MAFCHIRILGIPRTRRNDAVEIRMGLSENDLKNGLAPQHNNAYHTATILKFFDPKTQENLGTYLWDHSRYLGAGTCLWITLCIGLLLFRRRQYTRFLVLLPSCLLWGR